jgi:hypothetical protein
MNGFGVERDDVLFSIQRILSRETPLRPDSADTTGHSIAIPSGRHSMEPATAPSRVSMSGRAAIDMTDAETAGPARADLILLEAVPSFVSRRHGSPRPAGAHTS